MSWLFEDPLPVLVTLLAIEAVLAVALVRTGRAVVMAWMGGVLVAIVAFLAIEWLVITEREEVANTLHAMADALEANDGPALLSHVDESNFEARGLIAQALSHFEFSGAEVRDLSVRINRLTAPTTATADFIGRVQVGDRQTHVHQGLGVRRFVMQFVRRDDAWRMTSYEESNPI